MHEADLDDERFDAPEVLTITRAIFDGLFEHRRRALLLGRTPA